MDKQEYIYGKNASRECLKSNSTIKEVLLSSNFNDKELLDLIKQRKINVKTCAPQYLDKFFQNNKHQGIAIRIEPYKYASLDSIISKTKDKEDALIVELDGLQDPQNLGAIIRSCDAFGVDAIIIPESRSVGVTPSVVKVSTGAIEYVPIVQVTNLNQTNEILKKAGFWVVASDGNANQDYDQIDYNMKTVLVIGSEGKGISSLLLKNSDFITKIPMDGHVNSLNASVATGIYLAIISLSRKRGKHGSK